MPVRSPVVAFALALSAAANFARAHVVLNHLGEVVPQLFLGTPLNGAGPEQQWVAYGATPDAMTLSWITSAANASTTCVYGVAPAMGTVASGAPGKSYATLGYESGFIHIVRIKGLALATTYAYKCGDDATGWTVPATFTSSPGVGADIPYTFGVVGDLGQTNFSLATMQHLLACPYCDSVFITGDLSYADSEQPRWDSFQRLMQPLASTKPWMVASGVRGNADLL